MQVEQGHRASELLRRGEESIDALVADTPLDGHKPGDAKTLGSPHRVEYVCVCQ